MERSADQMHEAASVLLSIQPIAKVNREDAEVVSALLSVSPHIDTKTPERMPPPFNLLSVFSGIANLGKDALSHISGSKLGSPTVRRTCNLTPVPGEPNAAIVDLENRDFSVVNKDGRIGVYNPEARKALLAKFHRKRYSRIWNKKVRYTCRKQLADTRVRIKGRFVRRDGDGSDQRKEESATLAETTNTMDVE